MNRLVHPRGPHTSPIVCVGEAPGRDEDRRGYAFVGRSGRLFDHYCEMAGLRDPFITNLVRRWTGPGDPDPTKAEIARDWPLLFDELESIRPEIIVTLGAVSTRFFLGDVDMAVVHGIPHRSELWPEAILLPCYHPAAGLRDPYAASHCLADLRTAVALLSGAVKESDLAIVAPRRAPSYKPASSAASSPSEAISLPRGQWLALDTEGVPGAPWGFSYSSRVGSGRVVRYRGSPIRVSFPEDTRICFHLALYDLPMMAEMGINVPTSNLDDTIIMAYCLQLEPQALKALARRHLGLEMTEFKDLVHPHYMAAALSYLEKVAERDWGKPEEQLKQESKTGKWKVYRPQPLKGRVSRLLADLRGESKRKAKDPVDPLTRWKATPLEVRAPAEAEFGPFPELDIHLVPDAEAIAYSAKDADVTRRLAPILMKRLKAMNLVDVYRMDMAILPMVAEMMANGMPISLPHFEALTPKFDAEMATITDRVRLRDNRGQHINLRSGDQVADLLYNRLGMRPPKMTDTGARGKVDEKALQALANTHPHPILADLTNFREVATLKSSFSEKLPRHVGRDGRIHTTIRMTRVVSGRLSTADPNMQAIPAHSDLGKEIRNGFVAPEGYVFLSHDLDQVEMRWMAIVSGDDALINLFNSGVDVHSANAASIFRIPVEKVDRGIHRLIAKRVGFGIIMGISGAGLLDQLYLAGIYSFTLDQCTAFIEAWLDKFPRVREFMLASRREGRRKGYVQDYWGRIRYLPNIRCPIEYLKGEEERASHSHKIQAGAQGLMKRGMARAWQRILDWRETGLDVRPTLQIHDELLTLCPKGAEEDIGTALKACFEADSQRFPVKIGCKWAAGERWGDLKD